MVVPTGAERENLFGVCPVPICDKERIARIASMERNAGPIGRPSDCDCVFAQEGAGRAAHERHQPKATVIKDGSGKPYFRTIWRKTQVFSERQQFFFLSLREIGVAPGANLT